jgi:asparagine synthase (glutamine-hydrolysing)
VNDLLRPELRGHDIYDPILALYAQQHETGLNWVQRFFLSFYLRDQILVKVDRASMAASLEVRAPFLDTRIVELSLKLPWMLKLRGTSRKWLLKRAMRDVLPTAIVNRSKHGFAIPVAEWLKGPLRPMIEDLLSPTRLRDQGLFEPVAVRQLVTEHMCGARDHRKPLWTLLQFQLWRRQWLDPGVGSSARQTSRTQGHAGVRTGEVR